MIDYIWKIEQLDCIPSFDGNINVVSNIHWRINATDGTNKSEIYGTQSLTFNSKNDFVNYADLTKNEIISWVKEAMGVTAVTRLQEALKNQLEDLANPPIISLTLPWNN